MDKRFIAFLAATLTAAVVGLGSAPLASADPDDSGIARANCGPDSSPETGLQGQVPRRDRDSGRSSRGYWCNMTLIGRYQGEGAGVVSPSYDHCAYFGTIFPSPLLTVHHGVQVVDAGDEHDPRLSDSLASTAFLNGTWESLKVDPVHGRLAGTAVQLPPGVGGLAFDLYSIKDDCAKPRLLNPLAGNLTIPSLVLGHEGGFAPDGDTYYASSGTGIITAISLTDPRHPRTVYTGPVGPTSHGFSISPDGDTMYGVTLVPGGVQILDISDIQHRRPFPQIRQVGQVSWTDGFFSQHTLNFTKGDHKYLYSVDEAGIGAVRLIDIDDPTRPEVLREYRLEIQQPGAARERHEDFDGNGQFGYDGHYCELNSQKDPTLLACSYWESGLRLYDIHDLMHPREVAYYMPPAQTGLANRLRLRNSAHFFTIGAPPAVDVTDLLNHPTLALPHPRVSATTDYCSSPPAFKSDNRLWVTCEDNGFMALRYHPQ